MPPLHQSKGKRLQLRSRRGARGNAGNLALKNVLMLVGLVVAASCLGILYVLTPAGRMREAVRSKKWVPLPDYDNNDNAVAMDIIKSLECDELSDKDYGSNMVRRRRLDEKNEGENFGITDDVEEGFDPEAQENNEMGMGDDLYKDGYFQYSNLNAKHLFCLAAGTKKLPDNVNKDAFKCNVLGRRKQLLDVWASARTQMSLDVMQKTLGLAEESPRTLGTDTLDFWAPAGDDSVDFMLNTLNDDNSDIANLESVLGTGKVFVDVGSGLGFTTLAVSLKYPGTTVLSVEPAAPSWLLQRLNLACILPESTDIPKPILAGVGKTNDGMGKLLWKPLSTRRTRAWSSKTDQKDNDIELVVRLRTLKSILAEAAAEHDMNVRPKISVLNLDCEGCEYNVVPSWSDEEFNDIHTIIGTTGVHWGYIPSDKLPSSKRGATTHERLCSHYDFARQSIECCAFPDQKVKRPGESTSDQKTVAETAGDLCNGFHAWASDKNLYTSTDDFGWTELSSMSEMN